MNASPSLQFGNWVPGKMIAAPGILGLLFLALAALHWSFLIPALIFLLMAGYFAAARFLFSASGGDVQGRVQDLVVAHINWDGQGEALDIGCGNGPLTLKLARRFPSARITGLDFWGKNWDYSLRACEANARAAGVDGRVAFRQGTASALPFADARFDLVVSNLTFHEVRDTADKTLALREALRVLKPGGVFVLQDLFLLKSYFGSPEDLMARMRGWGASRVEFVRTCDEAFIPRLVKPPFMVGALAILRGAK